MFLAEPTDAGKIWIAIVSGLFSLLVALASAIYGYFANRKSQRELEVLKNDLATKQAELNARRDYEYEARKHLYQVCQPLLFQLVEMSATARNRISALARTARNGDLGPDHASWLARPGYFLVSTAYRLMSPLALFKLLQRRLTLVDLALDPEINARYVLARTLYWSFSQDFDLAKEEPQLLYDPDAPGAMHRRQDQPETYWRQGLYAGTLDSAAETLIVREPDGTLRCMSYGEFESAVHGKNSAVQKRFAPVIDILLDFHPARRPVFWRVLIVQAFLYKILEQGRQASSPGELVPWNAMSGEDCQEFDWRSHPDEAPDRAVREPFQAAEAFLKKRLERALASPVERAGLLTASSTQKSAPWLVVSQD